MVLQIFGEKDDKLKIFTDEKGARMPGSDWDRLRQTQAATDTGCDRHRPQQVLMTLPDVFPVV